MDFTGSGQRLSDDDVASAAQRIGCEPEALKAVLKVETAGSGFDDKKRPKILFEPHIFWRVLPEDLRPVAQSQGLAYPKWGMQPYPKGSDAQYQRLEAAIAVAEVAALMSCSWGLGQIMGQNYLSAGMSSVHDMVAECMKGEAEQLGLMANFIASSGLGQHLANQDWAAFARGYNGPAYESNAYDVKLAEAYAGFSAA